MPTLRDKMTADLRLRGMSASTEKQYLGCVRVYARFHNTPPDRLGTRQVREFLLHLRSLGRRPATLKVYWSALRFFYDTTLMQPEVMAAVPRPRGSPPSGVPSLTVAEVQLLLAASGDFDRVLFSVMYACGLRLSEACSLKSGDIDARGKLLHVRRGKGGKSRVTRLSAGVLAMLRNHWRLQQLPGPWLFPSRRMVCPGQVGLYRPWKDRPICPNTVGQRFRKVRSVVQLRRHVTLHDLRRAHATHLLEAGVDLRVIQVLLGHARSETTERYAYVSAALIGKTPCPLEKLG